MHIGSTISHYRIVEKLGEGGMGIVYKAEDTKLERTVALKFLAQHLLNDEEAKARFLREAKAAAALHHSNVCPVYEIDEVDGKTFLAMAFLQGETLEQQIAKGPRDIRDALDIGRQVADGLEAAHEAGIVHRDIKPANILVDAKGHATIMDFGLARLTEASRLTKLDTAMGTVAYMSPEQAQGMDVDSRSDIWSLGCVIYEMVSGQRPFRGVYDQALLYEIVHEEVAPLTSIRAGVPMELEFIVGKCLAKDRDDRTSTAHEVGRELRTLSDKLKSGRSTVIRTSSMTGAVPAMTTGAHSLNPAAALPPGAVIVQSKNQRALQTLAAICAVALCAVLFLHFTQAVPERPVRRFSLATEGLTQATVSPDGKYILYAAETDGVSSLWLRSLSDESARAISGTEGAIQGFWSPDSLSIGFATRSPSWELKRVAIAGGNAITLCALPSQINFSGGAWSPDEERIVISSGLKLYEVPARGGQAQLLLDATSEPRQAAVSPQFLPTGDGPAALVYSAANTPADKVVAVLNLTTGERRELGPGSGPVYSPDGYLIFGPGSSGGPGLWALSFSLSTLEATGEAFPISTAGFVPSVSLDGTLVYLDGVGGGRDRTLVWRDRSGAVLETVGQPQRGIGPPHLSPEGHRVAVGSREAGTGVDIWVHDLIRSTKTRLTFDPEDEDYPAWSPSGDQIVYWQYGAGVNRLMRKVADGTGEAVALVEAATSFHNSDWSRDGRYLVYQQDRSTGGSFDVIYVEIGADGTAGKPVTFLATPADEAAPKLSPDGRFVAYSSDESGRHEVYVQPFPNGAGRWQASVDGGVQPRWSRDGKELFYVNAALISVSVATGEGLTLGQPQKLFQSDDLSSTRLTPTYDVSADGQRFLTVAPIEQQSEAAPPTIRIVENWYEEFRDRER